MKLSLTTKFTGSLLFMVLAAAGFGAHVFYQIGRLQESVSATSPGAAGLEWLRWEALGVTLLLVAITFVVACFFHRTVARPVSIMAHTAHKLSQGDFTLDLDVSSQAEIEAMAEGFRQMIRNLRGLSRIAVKIANGDLLKQVRPYGDHDELGNAFKLMIDSLRKIVREVRSSAERVHRGGEDVTVTSRHIAEGANQQVSALEEVSQAIDEISGSLQGTARNVESQSGVVEQVARATSVLSESVKQVAENAERVDRLANEAAAEARAGGQSVSQVTASMGSIRSAIGDLADVMQRLGEKSTEINAIVSTISEIAEQTNLLALNAAIEAARAGQQGKGFAVVADEVRKLAGRASQSTKEIASLIKGVQEETERAVSSTEETTSRVEEGTRLANEAARAMEKIVETAVLTAQAVKEISLETRNQTRSVEETVKAASHLSHITQEVAAAIQQQSAGAEEVAAASSNLKDLARNNLDQAGDLHQAALHLTALAEGLEKLVLEFKLPEEETEGREPTPATVEKLRNVPAVKGTGAAVPQAV